MIGAAVLVTGGAGYVGSHACKALARAGYLPITYDNLSTGHESFVRWGPLVKGDIRDHATLRDAIIEHEVTSVLHFAACAYVGEFCHQPAEILRQQRCRDALAAARDARYRHRGDRVLELVRHLRRA